MGMTLWLGVRGEQGAEYDRSRDLSWMQKLSSELDGLCEAIGVAALSSFFDGSDLEYNLGSELGEVDEEAGPPAVDDMSWYDPAGAIETLSALCELLLGNAGTLPFAGPGAAQLLDEMTSLLPALEDAAAARQKVHLAIIM